MRRHSVAPEMAPPDDDRERTFRDAILYLIDVAACLPQRPRVPDPNADGLIDRVVDLVAQHRAARDQESIKALTARLAEDLAPIYRLHRDDREAQKIAISQLFGRGLAPGALEDLALTADEITKHRGPVEAARAEIGELFNVAPRSLHTWRDQVLPTAVPTAYGARTGARGLVKLAISLAGHPTPRFTHEILSALGFDVQRAAALPSGATMVQAAARSRASARVQSLTSRDEEQESGSLSGARGNAIRTGKRLGPHAVVTASVETTRSKCGRTIRRR